MKRVLSTVVSLFISFALVYGTVYNIPVMQTSYLVFAWSTMLLTPVAVFGYLISIRNGDTTKEQLYKYRSVFKQNTFSKYISLICSVAAVVAQIYSGMVVTPVVYVLMSLFYFIGTQIISEEVDKQLVMRGEKLS